MFSFHFRDIYAIKILARRAGILFLAALPLMATGLYLQTLPVGAGKLATERFAPDLSFRPLTPAAFEAGEELPGGLATSKKRSDNRNAFSHSSGNLSFKDELTFKIGNGLFRKLWVSSPASTKSSDGLGPLFNARSCQRCHLKDGRGHTPFANWPEDNQVSMFLRLAVPARTAAEKALLKSGKASVIPERTYGTQLQDLSIQGHQGEGHMVITYTPLPMTLMDGTVVTLRKPHYSVSDLAYGPMDDKVRLSPRVSPQMIGLGLLEAIPEADILALEDADDRDGDGISGRANRVWSLENKRLMLGRFGLKAGAVSVREQSAMAFAGDIGISNSLVPTPYGDCTKAQAFCRKAPHGADDEAGVIELSDKMLELVTFYAQNLAVPKRRQPQDEAVLKGKKLFHLAGCAGCHKPSFTTGALKGSPHLGQQTIWPYTDMLLHDMGEGLADELIEGRASGREWRTAPLWGIGLTETVSGHNLLLHDGRARGIEEAILWHGGEAARARAFYMALSTEERAYLMEFVRSL